MHHLTDNYFCTPGVRYFDVTGNLWETTEAQYHPRYVGCAGRLLDVGEVWEVGCEI